METDEPPDPTTNYGISVIVADSRIFSSNNKKEDIIYFRGEIFPYVIISEYLKDSPLIKPIPKPLRKITSQERQGLEEACQEIEQHRINKSLLIFLEHIETLSTPIIHC